MDSEIAKVARRAREIYLDTGFCCSESILLAVAESEGIESEWFPAVATGFCGGIAHTSGMCGALSGGIMAMGLLAGRKKPGDPRDKLFAMIQELLREFQQQFGTTNCTELLDSDLGTPEGLAQARAGNFRKQCADYVEAAAETTARLLRYK